MRAIRLRGVWAAAFAAALVCLPSAADEGATADAAPAEEAAVVVQVDIAETIEGRESKANYATYYVRNKLRELGFDAWSTRLLPIFKKRHDKAVAAARAAGEEPPALLEETQPEPALIVRGRITSELDRTSSFYGQDLAFVYKTEVALAILDGDGNELGTISFTDEFGRRDKKQARRDVLKRTGMFSAAEVLATEQVRAHLSEAQKTAADAWIAEINAKRKDGGS